MTSVTEKNTYCIVLYVTFGSEKHMESIFRIHVAVNASPSTSMFGQGGPLKGC